MNNLPDNITQQHPQFNAAMIPTMPCAMCQGEGGWECPICLGSGEVEMTEEDLKEEREANKESKAEL